MPSTITDSNTQTVTYICEACGIWLKVTKNIAQSDVFREVKATWAIYVALAYLNILSCSAFCII